MSNLFLNVVLEGQELRLELSPDTRLLFGRDKSCDIVVKDPTVSSEHMELLWDGRKLRVSDLKSKHGTKISTSSGDFVHFQQKVYPPSPTDIDFLLASAKLSLHWGLGPIAGERTQFADPEELTTPSLEATELRESPTIPSSRAASEPASSKNFPKSKTLADSKVTGQQMPQAKSATLKAKEKSEPRQKSSELVKLFLAVLIFFSYRNYWLGVLSPLLNLEDNLQGIGTATDMMFLSYLSFTSDIAFHLLAFVLFLFFVYKVNFQSVERMLGNWAHFFVPRIVKPLVFLFYFAGMLWPVVFLTFRGAGVEKLKTVHDFVQVEKQTASQLSLEKRSRTYLSFQESLQGSTYVYIRLLETRFQKIFQECTKEENQNWKQKKMCLVLFLAASIESYSDIRPSLNADVAARLCLLLSLDGIIRVLTVEGLDGASVPFFLNALESIGLTREQGELSKIISAEGAEKEQVLAALNRLRKALDKRIYDRQNELQLPEAFRLKPFNPLNQGV